MSEIYAGLNRFKPSLTVVDELHSNTFVLHKVVDESINGHIFSIRASNLTLAQLSSTTGISGE